MPIRRRISESWTPTSRGIPKTLTSAAYARGLSPVTSAISVVLPLPFSPRRIQRSPWRTVHEKSLNSVRPP